MLWLQDGSFLTWDSANQQPTLVVPDGLDPKLKDLAMRCGQVFVVLHADRGSQSAMAEACKGYSRIFAQENRKTVESVCFDLFALCALPLPDEDVRKSVVAFCAERSWEVKESERVVLLFEMLKPGNAQFRERYVKAGGSEHVAGHLVRICERGLAREQWKTDLLGMLESDFDRSFGEWVSADAVECNDWLLSFFATLLLTKDVVTTDVIRKEAEGMVLQEATDVLLHSILVKNKTQMVECLYMVSDNVVFLVHILDLAQMDTMMVETTNHAIDLNHVIGQYCEILVRDSEISAATGREVGLRQWLPAYLTRRGLAVTERLLGDLYPGLRKGLTGKVITSIEKTHQEEDKTLDGVTDTILNRVKAAKQRDEACSDSSWTEVASVLNGWFLKCPLDERRTIVDECGAIFNEIKGLNRDVIVALLISRLNMPDIDSIKPQLENLMFEYIAENGEMP